MAKKLAPEISKHLITAIQKGIICRKDGVFTYNLAKKYTYKEGPEEIIRAMSVAHLVILKKYNPSKIKLEVIVPRRTPSDKADVVLFKDDLCKKPYLVIENKKPGISEDEYNQAIEQGFGNANSLRAPYLLIDCGDRSQLFDVSSHDPTERIHNIIGNIETIPENYKFDSIFQLIAGGKRDIQPSDSKKIEIAVRRAHSTIWAGGKRDPLSAFEEWSKILFAKVLDERTTQTGSPRPFQVGIGESSSDVAQRIKDLFHKGCKEDPTVFPSGIKLNLPDEKISDVIKILQDISLTDTSVDNIGAAFERFFGSIFRGELGQYFTRRELSRFTVGALDVTLDDFVLDPTCGSGGFLLEALLQVWHKVDTKFKGQTQNQRLKLDFALKHVYGVEIHDTLARICKINLLLHHDGHTNIESDRSFLDNEFSSNRFNKVKECFSIIVGNPPFGDVVKSNDKDKLGGNDLANFALSSSKDQVDSEHVILEQSINFLEPGGKLGLILPDGFFNNSGELSNCPAVRRFLASNGRILGVVSLPDFAFKKSGAQNKTSILLYQKFSKKDFKLFETFKNKQIAKDVPLDDIILDFYKTNDYKVFFAEAENIGYLATGSPSTKNDLYKSASNGYLQDNQDGTILGEFRKFSLSPDTYKINKELNCVAYNFSLTWAMHSSHRLDPKYFTFKAFEETMRTPKGWVREKLGNVLRRKENKINPSSFPDREFLVLTLSQEGTVRPREAGQGNNPPEWLGSYFETTSSQWFVANSGDVVFSGIDLWKGSIAVLPPEFDGAIVTREYPIYEVTDKRLLSSFLSVLLRTDYYQRAFRAITTGHSNRRRTQQEDFEELEIIFPTDIKKQLELIKSIQEAHRTKVEATKIIESGYNKLSEIFLS